MRAGRRTCRGKQTFFAILRTGLKSVAKNITTYRRVSLIASASQKSKDNRAQSFFANNKNRIWNHDKVWCDYLLSAQPPILTTSEVQVSPQTRRIFRQTSGVRQLSPESCSEDDIRSRHMVIKLLSKFVYFRQKITGVRSSFT